MVKSGIIADIGATNARFALTGEQGIYAENVLKCADYPGPAEAVQAYLEQASPACKPQAGSFAVAAPIIGERLTMTNHPWSFSIPEIKEKLALERLSFLNDFEAIALAVPHLGSDDLTKIRGDEPIEHAPRGVIGPGTGLGVASLFWDGHGYRSIAGEGGHVTMPAKTQRELDLFMYLRAHKYRHVSAERVCSGKGLVNIYNAIRGLDGRDDLPDRTAEEISATAIGGSCPVCEEALDLMLGFLGTVAGNLALTLGAHGGIYIAGGIIGKLGAYFESSRFSAEFVAKGRFEEYLVPVPVYLIRHEFPAFIGLQADLLRDACA